MTIQEQLEAAAVPITTNGHPACIAQTQICEGLRVSTGIFRSCSLAGYYDQYETLWWNDAGLPIAKWNQIIHGTKHCSDPDAPYIMDERLKAKALRVHTHIARNLLSKYGEVKE